ncbi:Hypothetical protein AA314_03074 [Archangium gephyra]|nr:Hypothetical protein AA314_03074 [Archangium gephyra]
MGCGLPKTPRAEAEALLHFPLPLSASDIQVEDGATDILMTHKLVSFTFSASELAAVMSRLPCAPSATGWLGHLSTLDPVGPGEQVCQSGKYNDFEAVKLSPRNGARVQVVFEKFVDVDF